MKKLIKRILRPFYLFAKRTAKKLVLRLEMVRARKASIIKADEAGQVVKTIKEESIEKVSINRVYGLIEGGEIDFIYPELNLMKYTNATVFTTSDFVLCEKGAVWDKYHTPQFTKIVPLDRDLLKRKNTLLYIRKPKSTYKIQIGYSLCGVHSHIWSHFLVQYLPKLYLLPDLLAMTDEKITVILPNYTDPQIREIVHTYLKKFNNVDILELNKREAVQCDVLYHIKNTATISDHAEYISPADLIIPRLVHESLKNNFLKDYLNDENEVWDGNEGNKLFIARNSGRNIKNYPVVEEYFRNKGYTVVSPHSVSLEEKAKMFRNASVIVGPLSSGFTNLVFCKEGTKVLQFANFQRIFDLYAGFLTEFTGSEILFITGMDESSKGIHSSYCIPMEKIAMACEDLGI